MTLTDNGNYYPAHLLARKAQYIQTHGETPEQTLQTMGVDFDELQSYEDPDEVNEYLEEALERAGFWRSGEGDVFASLDQDDDNLAHASEAIELTGLPGLVEARPLVLRLMVDSATCVTFARLANRRDQLIPVGRFIREAVGDSERDSLGFVPYRLMLDEQLLRKTPSIRAWCKKNDVDLCTPSSASTIAFYEMSWSRDICHATENWGTWRSSWWHLQNGATMDEIDRSVRWLSRRMTGTQRAPDAPNADELDEMPPHKHFEMGGMQDIRTWAKFMVWRASSL